MNRTVYLLFFISGISGLLFQVIWVRMFGNIFGNTVHSAALVTSVFMGGLGVGSYVAGRLIDKIYLRAPALPVRLYAYSEIAIGILGVTVAFLLPHLDGLSATLSSYKVGESGWHELSWSSYLVRYAVAVGLLAPITLLMGGTLTLLIRFVLRENLANAGKYTGWLYGLNTFGAALGAFSVDFFFVPTLGLFSTQLVAALLNLVAGVGALKLCTNISENRGVQSEPPPTPAARHLGRLDLGFHMIWAALFFSGFAAMGMEIVWFRFLTSAVGQYRSVFSLLLFVILVGLWLGAVGGGWLTSRMKNPVGLFVFAQLAFACTSLISFFYFETPALHSPLLFQQYISMGSFRNLFELWLLLGPILQLVAIPAFFMGFAYPVANSIVQGSIAEVGRRAGLLYLGNTAGAVAGSLIAGFVLIPTWGTKVSVAIFVACVGTSLPLLFLKNLYPAPARRKFSNALGVFSLLVAFVLLQWSRLPSDFLALRSFRSGDVFQYLKKPFMLKVSEGLSESIVILELPGEQGARRLYTNGHLMSASAEGAQRYMRAFVHVPLLLQPDPKNVLVICFGVGNTSNAATLYPGVEKIEVVDLSKNVLRHARYFANTNGNVIKDPRVSVFVNDGRQHLKMQAGEKYDLVTLEPPPLAFAGVGSLYSLEFYQLAREHLKPDGYLTQWLPIRQLPGETVLSLVRAFVEVFPDAVLLNGEYGDLILMGKKSGKTQLEIGKVEARLANLPKVRDDLKNNNMGEMLELAGTFAADANTLKKASERSFPITDDDPAMEYAQSLFLASMVPPTLFDWKQVHDWCPDCKTNPATKDLETYLQILQTLNLDRSFALVTAYDPLMTKIKGLPMTEADFKRTVAASPYLKRLLTRFEFDSKSFNEK